MTKTSFSANIAFMVIAASLASTSQAAFAQSGSGSALDERRRAAEVYGECIASQTRLRAASLRFLRTGDESEVKKLDDDRCMTIAVNVGGIGREKEVSYPPDALRALLADGLVRVHFRERGPADFLSVAPLDHSPAKGSKLSETVETARKLAAELGECTARVSPEEVRKLALANAASPEEMTRIRALVPTFAQCLPPGVQLAFPPSVLRDASVLAYARLAYANEG